MKIKNQNKLDRIEKAILATKNCTKALMKLSYKNYLSNVKDESRISNRNIRDIENFKN